MNEAENIKQLPKDWKWVKLGEVCEKVEAVKRKEKNTEEELLYLDIGGIDNSANKILSHKNYKWKDAPSRAQQIVFKDDILFSTVRTYMKNIAVVENKIYDGQIASSGFCVIRSNKRVTNPKFVFYYTVSQSFLRPLNELQTGSSYPAVRDKDVFIQPFPLPPKPTQQAIVSKIEELFSELDKGIENLRTAQQQLKTYRQSVLKWAFEGKLTNENVKEGELPKGWKIVELKEVCEIKRGKSKHRPRNEPALYGGKYPFIQTGDIRNASGRYITEYSQTYSDLGLHQSKLWPKGTLCITIAANIGETAILGFDACFPDSVVGLLCNEKLLLNKYTNYFFVSYKQKLEELAPATAQKNINVDILEKVVIPLAPIEEQKKIVQEIESRLSVADKMEESITQSLQQAEALRQSILKKAFEGRLVS